MEDLLASLGFGYEMTEFIFYLALGGIILTAYFIFEFRLFRIKWRKRFLRRTLNRRLWQGIIAHILVLLSSAAFVTAFEKGFLSPEKLMESPFSTYPRAFLALLVPSLVIQGWEMGAPLTFAGEIVAVIATVYFFTNGITRIGTEIFLILHNIFLQRRSSVNVAGHYLICGWNSRLDDIVRQLTEPALGERRKPIVLLSNKDYEDSVRRLIDKYDDYWREIEAVYGSMSHVGDLKDACAQFASSILIVPPEWSKQPDQEVLFCALALKKIFDEEKLDTRPNIIAKVNDAVFADRLEVLVDKVICGSKRDFLLAADALINPKIVDIVKNLVTVSEDTCEFYDFDVPKQFVGMRFEEVSYKLYCKTRELGNPVILIGIEREGKLFVNPKIETRISELKSGDRLYCMSYEYPVELVNKIAQEMMEE